MQPRETLETQFLAATIPWMRSSGYDVTCVDTQIDLSAVRTWGKSLLALQRSLLLDSLGLAAEVPLETAASLYESRNEAAHHKLLALGKSMATNVGPMGVAKAFWTAENATHINKNRLREALAPYVGQAPVVGLRAARLTGGNTRVVFFLQADALTPDEMNRRMDAWLRDGEGLQHIGLSLGQAYGEALVGLYTLGLQGFRFQQPVELYPILFYSHAASYHHHVSSLMSKSMRERLNPRTTSIRSFILPSAPIFLQAVFVSLTEGRVAFLEKGQETRRAWKHYNKPKLAARIFNKQDLDAVMHMIHRRSDASEGGGT